MAIDWSKIVETLLVASVPSLITSSIAGVSVYFSTKKKFENHTKKEIAKFNVIINGLNDQISNLQKKASKVRDLEAEVKKSRELFEELKTFLEEYLKQSNKTGNK